MSTGSINNTATFSDTRTFDFTCSLQNGETAVEIKKDSIMDLVIEDTTMNWYVRGYIDIMNPRGALEASIANIQDYTRETYIFRNDSTDFLDIRMCPNLASLDDTNTTIHDDFYVMHYRLSVYSVKDITSTSGDDKKIKRLFFVDYRYLLFSKLNSTFTTSAYLTGAVAQLDDRDREIPSGDAIKNLITESLPDEQIFSPSWESGSSRIEFTSPANNRCIDDLDELVNMHVSDDVSGNQPCILHLDRATSTWSMVPLSTLFDYAVQKTTKGIATQYVPGIWQTEQFVIGRDVGFEERDSVNLNEKVRTPQTNSLYINYNFGTSSNIENYRFVEMHGDMNQTLFTTHPVHQNNIRTKQFMINMSTANTSALTSMLKKQVVDNMIVDQSTIDDVPLSVNVDPTRYQNRTLEHVYVSSDLYSSMLSSGRNNLLKKILFQSNAIEFTVPGETTRRATRFISVQSNKTSGTHENKHNDKVEGQYLVIGVTHRIKNNTYTNKIVGVKPYNFAHNFASDKAIMESYTNEQG